MSASPPPLTLQGGLAQSLAQKPLHSVKCPQARAVGPGQVTNSLSLDHFFSDLRQARCLVVSGCCWTPPGESSPSEGHLTSWCGCKTHLTPALRRGWCASWCPCWPQPHPRASSPSQNSGIAAGTRGVTNQRLRLAISRAKSRSEDVRTTLLLLAAWPSSLPVSSCCCLTSRGAGAGGTPEEWAHVRSVPPHRAWLGSGGITEAAGTRPGPQGREKGPRVVGNRGATWSLMFASRSWEEWSRQGSSDSRHGSGEVASASLWSLIET